MRHVIVIGLLTVLWALLSASADPWTLVAGACFSALAWGLSLHFIRKDQRSRRRVRLGSALRLLLSFVIALLGSAISVAREAFRPRLAIRPAFLRYPIRDRSPGAVTALASMISLTPGTLSLDVSQDRDELYIHVLQSGNGSDTVRDDIRARLEGPLNRAFPPVDSKES